MLTLKLLLISFATVGVGFGVFLAQMDGNTWGLILTGIGTIITAIFGGLVLYITTKSKTRIDEMKIEAELKKVQDAADHRVQEVRMEAQKAVSLVNANALSNVQSLLAANTAETVKSTTASDQVKVRVEQLEAKLSPPIKQSDVPAEVTVVNSPSDPVNTTSVFPKE